ncbi:iron-containing alcohol dehydrogenase family protein, partial [Vibrio parahaemolyticus V-223/04]
LTTPLSRKPFWR